jgi:hypothetical protein
MVNEAVRLLVDRVKNKREGEGRTVVFPTSLVVGDSCAPLKPRYSHPPLIGAVNASEAKQSILP